MLFLRLACIASKGVATRCPSRSFAARIEAAISAHQHCAFTLTAALLRPGWA